MIKRAMEDKENLYKKRLKIEWKVHSTNQGSKGYSTYQDLSNDTNYVKIRRWEPLTTDKFIQKTYYIRKIVTFWAKILASCSGKKS
jgi:hypothetical protein